MLELSWDDMAYVSFMSPGPQARLRDILGTVHPAWRHYKLLLVFCPSVPPSSPWTGWWRPRLYLQSRFLFRMPNSIIHLPTWTLHEGLPEKSQIQCTQMKLTLFHHKPHLPPEFPISVNRTTIYPVVQAAKFGNTLSSASLIRLIQLNTRPFHVKFQSCWISSTNSVTATLFSHLI